MYTLNDLTLDINTALNYPAITFQDIKLYLNQAISELNSSLHISIRNVNDIITENYKRAENMPNLVALTEKPKSTDIILSLTEDPAISEHIYYYWNTNLNVFRKLNGLTWESYEELYASYIAEGTRTVYKATLINDVVYWIEEIYNNPLELDFSEYICNDWITLFIIPYVCFKFSARDNDTGAIFSEEFTQGFQQLQTAYRIPDKVLLTKYAGRTPYITDVKNNLSRLNIMCPTRAITEDMKIPRDIQATFGSMFNKGGWGI